VSSNDYNYPRRGLEVKTCIVASPLRGGSVVSNVLKRVSTIELKAKWIIGTS
jgi:hypothetical protein